MLTALDRQAKQAAALAAEAEAAASGSKQLLLRLGQRVVHKEHGFRGVVVGWDVGCCETEDWQERAEAAKLKKGLRYLHECVFEVVVLVGISGCRSADPRRPGWSERG